MFNFPTCESTVTIPTGYNPVHVETDECDDMETQPIDVDEQEKEGEERRTENMEGEKNIEI